MNTLILAEGTAKQTRTTRRARTGTTGKRRYSLHHEMARQYYGPENMIVRLVRIPLNMIFHDYSGKGS